ncbi:MAG TPA: Zn-ribbon domain-containing OB-fold protein [Hyphomicrobiaceae bacterium]|nr:Zn-ribbon domain-containing OB-fold protein [Hyphomicrobiaceae bacterium]
MAATKERKIASPEPTVGSEAYWEGARNGKLLLRHCTSCDRVHHYPRALCPHCFSDKLDWKEASGKGKIYTYSVMRRAPEPYVIAYVTLDEGVSMMTNIVDCDFDKVRIDQPVKVVFKASENGQPVPMFTPA